MTTREYLGAFDEIVDAPLDTKRAEAKSIIRVQAGEISRLADEAERALVHSGLPIFRRAGSLVRPICEALPAAHGRTTIVAKLRALTRDTMVDCLNRVAKFERYDARRKAMIVIDPPTAVASLLLEREDAWTFRRVAGLATAPTLRPDGSILAIPGYDEPTGLFLIPDHGLRMPAIAENPSRDDALTALELLRDLLSEFPFVSDLDRAVALSGLMTAMLRNAMSTAPLHLIRAHTAGSGKSYLIDVFAVIANGRLCPVITTGPNEEEAEKRLGALLRDGVSIISLDNASGELGGNALCQITERPIIRMRILGLSEVPEFECRSAIFATGNNLRLRDDMTRRAVVCNLDAKLERPELREFRFDPVTRVQENRGRYVAAVLTIARAYRAAGSPLVCGPIGSYAEWSQNARSALIWLGEKDPVQSMEMARAEDPVLGNIRELMSHWRDHLETPGNYTTQAIIAHAVEKDQLSDKFVRPEFRDCLIRIAGDGGSVSSLRLGKWLARHAGRIVDGYRLDMVSGKHGARFFLARTAAV